MKPNTAIHSINKLDIITLMPSPKTKAIIIRVSEEDHRAFAKGANAEDATVSDWFRRLGRRRLNQLGLSKPKPSKKGGG